ncbi:MAG: RimK/LysX family protein [Rhodocyclaceae bacterium]
MATHASVGRRGLAASHGLAAALFAIAACGAAQGAPELTVIGAVEEVALMPEGIVVPARIDTGAAKSSLAARNLEIRDRVASFRLPEGYGGAVLRLRVVSWARVRSNLGTERRPVVEVDLCIASRRLRTRVNLDDREGLQYPMLLGRNTLEGNFLVDVQRSGTQPPHCVQERP